MINLLYRLLELVSGRGYQGVAVFAGNGSTYAEFYRHRERRTFVEETGGQSGSPFCVAHEWLRIPVTRKTADRITSGIISSYEEQQLG